MRGGDLLKISTPYNDFPSGWHFQEASCHAKEGLVAKMDNVVKVVELPVRISTLCLSGIQRTSQEPSTKRRPRYSGDFEMLNTALTFCRSKEHQRTPTFNVGNISLSSSR